MGQYALAVMIFAVSMAAIQTYLQPRLQKEWRAATQIRAFQELERYRELIEQAKEQLKILRQLEEEHRLQEFVHPGWGGSDRFLQHYVTCVENCAGMIDNCENILSIDTPHLVKRARRQLLEFSKDAKKYIREMRNITDTVTAHRQ